MNSGGNTTRSTVGPAFVFKRAAMSHIMEWMQTSADAKERGDFKRVHELLDIDAAADPSSITDAGVHVPAAAKTVERPDDGSVHDPELERLDQGLQAITREFWKKNLKTSLGDADKQLCWDILQKVVAADRNTRTYKDTTYNTAHAGFGPHYQMEPRRSDYSNLSTALPLQKTHYPPGTGAGFGGGREDGGQAHARPGGGGREESNGRLIQSTPSGLRGER